MPKEATALSRSLWHLKADAQRDCAGTSLSRDPLPGRGGPARAHPSGSFAWETSGGGPRCGTQESSRTASTPLRRLNPA